MVAGWSVVKIVQIITAVSLSEWWSENEEAKMAWHETSATEEDYMWATYCHHKVARGSITPRGALIGLAFIERL